MLKVEGVNYHVAGREMLRDIDFVVNAGEKVGLVGVNGSGKSTLLKIIVDEIDPDSGIISKLGRVGYFPQAVTLYGQENDKTVFEYVAEARGLNELISKLRKLEIQMEDNPENLDRVLDEYGKVQSAFDAAGGWEAEADILNLLAGLGLDFIQLDRKMGTLSGGQKTRVALAKVLFSDPELMILDEPTNHLDVETKIWLMEYLARFKGAILMVSHDLEMLDNAVTKILYLNEFNHEIQAFYGNYTSFLQQKETTDRRIQQTLKAQKAEIERLRDAAFRNLSAGPKKAGVGHSILKRVERMEAQLPDEPQESRAIKVNFGITRESGDMVLSVSKLSKSYGDKEVVKPIDFTVHKGERWAVIGVNGAGKSTLLKMIVNIVPPTSGTFRLGTSVDVGYYAQEHEELDPNRTLLEEVRLVSDKPDGYLRNALAHFLFYGDKVFEPVRVLSGGERSRLALCKLVLQGHNFLIVDEPTNNLDPLSVEKLLNALVPYGGTMLIVSHDLGFLQDLRPSKAILMPETRVVPFDDRVYDRVGKWE